MSSYEYDKDLDGINVSTRLPTLSAGEYLLSLNVVKHVEGATGIYDIAEVTVLEGKGEDASSGKAKISFKRDETNKMRREIKNKQIAEFLTAVAGENIESKSEFLAGLRDNPEFEGTKFRAVVTSHVAEKSKNEYKNYKFMAA